MKLEKCASVGHEGDEVISNRTNTWNSILVPYSAWYGCDIGTLKWGGGDHKV